MEEEQEIEKKQNKRNRQTEIEVEKNTNRPASSCVNSDQPRIPDVYRLLECKYMFPLNRMRTKR